MNKLRKISIALFISVIALFPTMGIAMPINNDIAKIETVQPSITVNTGSISLTILGEEPVLFQIYSITGQIIKTITLDHGTISIDLPRGYYIVKCPYWSKTVIVK